MNGGRDSAQPERHKNAGAKRPPRRLRELVPKADGDAQQAEHAHHRQVYDLPIEMAIETIIHPRHERAHYQQRYSAIVQLREQVRDQFRVAVDRVKYERESKTEYRAHEERSEYELLLKLYFGPCEAEEKCRRTYKRHAAQEMRPYIRRLRVQPEDTAKARTKTGQWRSMTVR